MSAVLSRSCSGNGSNDGNNGNGGNVGNGDSADYGILDQSRVSSLTAPFFVASQAPRAPAKAAFSERVERPRLLEMRLSAPVCSFIL